MSTTLSRLIFIIRAYPKAAQGTFIDFEKYYTSQCYMHIVCSIVVANRTNNDVQ